MDSSRLWANEESTFENSLRGWPGRVMILARGRGLTSPDSRGMLGRGAQGGSFQNNHKYMDDISA
eukprot:7982634-Pyramimonas_sp.AAC.1